jgi:hypothetical protein
MLDGLNMLACMLPGDLNVRELWDRRSRHPSLWSESKRPVCLLWACCKCSL